MAFDIMKHMRPDGTFPSMITGNGQQVVGIRVNRGEEQPISGIVLYDTHSDSERWHDDGQYFFKRTVLGPSMNDIVGLLSKDAAGSEGGIPLSVYKKERDEKAWQVFLAMATSPTTVDWSWSHVAYQAFSAAEAFMEERVDRT